MKSTTRMSSHWCNSCRQMKHPSEFSNDSRVEYEVIEATIGECMIQGLYVQLCRTCLPKKDQYIQKEQNSYKCGKCQICKL
jgi:hypothetical protein